MSKLNSVVYNLRIPCKLQKSLCPEQRNEKSKLDQSRAIQQLGSPGMCNWNVPFH